MSDLASAVSLKKDSAREVRLGPLHACRQPRELSRVASCSVSLGGRGAVMVGGRGHVVGVSR